MQGVVVFVIVLAHTHPVYHYEMAEGCAPYQREVAAHPYEHTQLLSELLPRDTTVGSLFPSTGGTYTIHPGASVLPKGLQPVVSVHIFCSYISARAATRTCSPICVRHPAHHMAASSHVLLVRHFQIRPHFDPTCWMSRRWMPVRGRRALAGEARLIPCFVDLQCLRVRRQLGSG